MQTYLDDSQEKAVRSVSGLEIWLVFLHGCSHVFFWKQKEQKKRRISKPVEDAGDCGNDHQHPLLPVQFTMEFKTSAWVHIVWIRCSLFFLSLRSSAKSLQAPHSVCSNIFQSSHTRWNIGSYISDMATMVQFKCRSLSFPI